MMNDGQLEITAANLDKHVSIVASSDKIDSQTKDILLQQAGIYAAALSDYIADRVETTKDAVVLTIQAVEEFCSLISKDLA